MPPDPAPTLQTPSNDGAVLEQKLVGKIKGRFFVARYQRGYRWGTDEVEQLLNDIHEHKGEDYSLQPVVVKLRAGEPGTTPEKDLEWELVDGQQRLTTLYLIFLYMKRAGLKNVAPPYSITYETRPESGAYLHTLDPELPDKYIDFYHLSLAYECIEKWFAPYDEADRQFVADQFYGALFAHIKIIWYQAPADLDAVTLFTRLNVGRIALTDAELVKALLLTRIRIGDTPTDRAQELAAQWDAIERDLRHPDLWAFVTTASGEEYPTRITLLLDALVGGPLGAQRPRYHTFESLRPRIDEKPTEVWEDIVALHGLIRGWYENRDQYHKIGYLVAAGENFGDLVKLAENLTKTGFDAQLNGKIRERLNLTRNAIPALDFTKSNDKYSCHLLFTLMNVESVRRLKNSSERYPFHAHHSVERWSLEHIHAQQADTLSTVEQWTVWLREHRAALAALPVDEAARPERDALAARIDDSIEGIDGTKFAALVPAIMTYFIIAEEPGKTPDSLHSVSNLALLPSAENSALSNSVFEVKRRLILKLDRAGAYIPVCTRHVFLKYYSSAEGQQIHFWSRGDRESYLKAMIDPDDGLITPYLQPEEKHA